MMETITTQVDKDRNRTVKKKIQLQMKEDNVHQLKLTEKMSTFRLIMASLFINCLMIRPTILYCNRIIRVKTNKRFF